MKGWARISCGWRYNKAWKFMISTGFNSHYQQEGAICMKHVCTQAAFLMIPNDVQVTTHMVRPFGQDARSTIPNANTDLVPEVVKAANRYNVVLKPWLSNMATKSRFHSIPMPNFQSISEHFNWIRLFVLLNPALSPRQAGGQRYTLYLANVNIKTIVRHTNTIYHTYQAHNTSTYGRLLFLKIQYTLICPWQSTCPCSVVILCRPQGQGVAGSSLT